jgi:hypothetical protein
MRKTGALLAALALSACGEEDLPPGEIVLTLGQESDTWNGAETALVELENDEGEHSELLRKGAPIKSFEMGKGGVTTFVVSGLDASGAPQARGRSLPINRAGFSGVRLPLFVSRASELGRPPDNLPNAHPDHPPVQIVGGRYLYAFGATQGDKAVADIYDFGSWQSITQGSMSCPTPPCRVESLAVVAGTLALAVGDDWGIAMDLAAGTAVDAPKPEGLESYAEVSGGATIHADDGSAYLIGGTRNDDATSSVIHVDPDGLLERVLLSAPRAGAAATWMPGRGLVVVGGGDAQAAGAELLAEGASAFVPLEFPADRTTGAALVSLDDNTVLRLGGRTETGGVAETVSLALGCGSGCTPAVVGAPLDLVTAKAFPLGESRALVVGDDASGNTQVIIWSEAASVPVPMREPRKGASAIEAPTGHIAIFGGTHPDGSPALSVELFIQ